MTQPTPLLSNRMAKAWRIARRLDVVPTATLFDPAINHIDQATRRFIASSERDVSDHTWNLAIGIARRLHTRTSN